MRLATRSGFDQRFPVLAQAELEIKVEGADAGLVLHPAV